MNNLPFTKWPQCQLSIIYRFRQQSIRHNFRRFKPGRAHLTLLLEECKMSVAEDKHLVILNMTSVASGYILHSGDVACNFTSDRYVGGKYTKEREKYYRSLKH